MMNLVYLSPSTQEKNIGVSTYGAEEVYCNLLTDQIEKILDKYRVEYKRNRPDMTLREVVVDSNIYMPRIHLAIHTNAKGEGPNTTVQGCEVFIHKPGGEREIFGKIVYERISNLTPWVDHGIKYGENWYGPGKPMYELANTDAPAVLVEIDYHDNLTSVNWLLKNSNTIARELAYSILDYFKIPILPDIDYSAQVRELTDQLARIKQAYVEFGKLL